MKKGFGIITILAVAVSMLAGCGAEKADTAVTNNSATNTQPNTAIAIQKGEKVSQLYVNFGDSAYFTMHLNDNPTAQAIANYVGTQDWQLPIYHYNDYENWEIMQYYDIPSRYKIPSNPEKITKEAAGTVYYSEPNRMILYFGDGEVAADYTPVGYFDITEEMVQAIENNPVVAGWGNKLIHITAKQK